MRVLTDTNILFSALLFPQSKPAKALMWAADHCELILCDQNITELNFAPFCNARPRNISPVAETLLAELSHELIPAIRHTEKLILDIQDQPILNAAVLYDVDVIITGDKDFLSLNLDHPECITAAQFLEREVLG